MADTPTTTRPKPAPLDRMLAVDLRGLSDEQMSALTDESIRRGMPLSRLLGELINETSRRILGGEEQAA